MRLRSILPDDLRSFLLLAIVLIVLLTIQFHKSFESGWVLRLNDGPLSSQLSAANEFPGAFDGLWQDLTWIGAPGGAAMLDGTYLLRWLLGPWGFCKFHAPVAILFSGLCAWLAFRSVGISRPASVIGGLAAALNSNFFSNACWGLASRPFTLGFIFLAIAIWSASNFIPKMMVRGLLAGICLGLGVTESADVGVILSGLFAGYLLTRPNIGLPRVSWIARTSQSGGALLAVIFGAVITAFPLLSALMGAGVDPFHHAGTEFPSREAHWQWATQWSLPKSEIPRVAIAGLHGYLMQTEDGNDYWGAAGREPGWQEGSTEGARYSGAGEYAGMIVCILALFSVAQSLRGTRSALESHERQTVRFWATAGILCLALSLGKYAPFYQWIASLPYFSSTRNPVKWMHGFHLAVVILSAFGTESLLRSARQLTLDKKQKQTPISDSFYRRWNICILCVFLLFVVFAMTYTWMRPSLEAHLVREGIVPRLTSKIASTSIREVWISVCLFMIGSACVSIGLYRTRNPSKPFWISATLALILTVDLLRANAPWIVHYDGAKRYDDSAIWKVLRSDPIPSRTTVVPVRHPQLTALDWLHNVYQGEWLQHAFACFNIPSIDRIQDPRPAPENVAFREALAKYPTRFWELTSTRFFLGLNGDFVQLFNQAIDPSLQRFRLLLPFSVEQDPTTGFRPTPDSKGPFGIMEFSGALPRATIYGRWMEAEDRAALDTLSRPEFEPQKTVLVSTATPAPQPESSALASRSNLTVRAYSPKRIALTSDADGSTVVLLNDKFHSDWKVQVDGRPASLLRCNYIMRGVQVPSGRHEIEFRFEPPGSGWMLTAICCSAASLLLIRAWFLKRTWIPRTPRACLI